MRVGQGRAPTRDRAVKNLARVSARDAGERLIARSITRNQNDVTKHNRVGQPCLTDDERDRDYTLRLGSCHDVDLPRVRTRLSRYLKSESLSRSHFRERTLVYHQIYSYID